MRLFRIITGCSWKSPAQRGFLTRRECQGNVQTSLNARPLQARDEVTLPSDVLHKIRALILHFLAINTALASSVGSGG
jgi:hypothetical protein